MSPLFCLATLQVAGGLSGMLDAWLTRIAERQWTARAAEVASIQTPDDVARRQKYIREKFLASLGGLPEKTPLHAVLTGTLVRDGYRVEKLIYESVPGFKVTANVYVPLRQTPPFPAVIGVAGHSNTGKAEPAYQSAWISMARRGFLVLALDPPGQGERSEYWDAGAGKSSIGIGTREHTMAGLQCLLTGTNIARYEVWDGIRAFDYLLTRKDVDGARIAVAGNSGGGTQSAYLAVAEPRLAAAAPSCYITSWQQLWSAPGPQDAEQNLHGFLRDGLNFGDFLIAFAPKPIQMMTATRDFFPIDGARATFEEVAKVFQAAGVRDHVAMFEYDDGHGWSKPRREATYRFLEKWFHGRLEEGLEAPLELEPAENLQATSTGQLATSGGSETVSSLNRKLAQQLYPKREAAQPGAVLSRLITVTLGLSSEKKLTATAAGRMQRDGYQIERIAIGTEEGITVPSLLLLPNAPAGPLPAVLYLNTAGKATDAAPGGDMEAIVKSGHAVLAIDVRGTGETAPVGRQGGYTSTYQSFMRAYLTGNTLAGMQVTDVLQSLRFLRERTNKRVDPARLAIFGKANGGVLALYAAALDPAVTKIAIEGALTSYMELARAPRHEGVLDLIVPGVLRQFDLPDLARSIAPRRLWIVNPTDSMGLPATANEYGSQQGLRKLQRTAGESFDKTYANWLAY